MVLTHEDVSPDVAVESTKPASRRLNFILTQASFEDFQRMAFQTGRSMTDLLRYALGVMKIVVEAHRSGQRIVVIDKDNKAVKEIVLPF
jgi:hypothetical protein